MNATASEFIKRLPEAATTERELISTAFQFPDAVRTKAAGIRANKNLSEVGKSEALRKLVTEGGVSTHFGQLKAQAKTWHVEVQSARAAMKPKVPEKGDLNAAVQHWEIREFLRSLPDGERMRVAFEPEFAQAVAGAPPALSGLPKDVYEKVVEAAIERELGPRVEMLRQREQIVETVNAALKVAEGQIRSEAGLEAGESL